MHQLSLVESSKPPSPQKANLLVELEETKRSLMQKEEYMRQLVERMQRLEDTQERQTESGDGSLEELLDNTCTMEVKKKKKIGECKILKLGAHIIINQRRLYLFLNYLVLMGIMTQVYI